MSNPFVMDQLMNAPPELYVIGFGALFLFCIGVGIATLVQKIAAWWKQRNKK